MFLKKFSNVLHEAEHTKSGKRRKRFVWLHVLAILCLMCFIFLIILINVDSSGINGKRENLTEKMVSVNIYKGLESYDYAPVKSGQCNVYNNGCKIQCFRAQNDQNLISLLESQYKICKGPLDLNLYDTEFEEDTFGENELVGNFVLANLSLECCELRIISDNAFDNLSLNNLKVLKIVESKIKNMNEKTFAGLENLQVFEMSNFLGGKSELLATAAFKPIAKSLIEMLFVNLQYRSSGFYTEHWLQGAEFIKLKKVNFKGNYFPDTLSRNSFVNLKSVEILNLQACTITFLAHDTFDEIITTLTFVDLSFNKLKMLDAHLVENFANTGIKLALENNHWDCNCDNCELITTLKNDNIKLSKDPVCIEPTELRYMKIKLIELSCCENNTETTEETTTTKTVTSHTSDSATKITETTPIVSTTEFYNLIELKCKRFSNENETMIHAVKAQLTAFNIKMVTPTKVIITVQVIPADAIFVYFNTQKSANARYQTFNNTIIEIDDLVPAQTYAFCLALTNVVYTSPFNCRSHHMSLVPLKPTAWLSSSDKILFILLTIIGVIICLLIGVILCYALLRWRTHLIRHQYNAYSNDLYSHRSSSTLKFYNTDEVSSVYSSNYKLRSNEYMKYFKSTALPTCKIEVKNLQENLPPNQRAPALPPISELFIVSTKPDLTTNDDFSKDTIPEYLNEHVYQSLDEYQRIYGLR